MLTIDGSRGEGGGQIIRTSLALALLTGRAVRLENIRAKRTRPGLLRQHLTALRAAARIGAAEIVNDELGASTVEFRPQGLHGGHYEFSVGSAGSAGLVLQTVLPALLTAKEPSHLVLSGGTHNPMSPPFDFLERAFLPLLRRMGARIEIRLERHGFYPAGGGRFIVDIEPSPLQPLILETRGDIVSMSARALVAHLPKSVAERELKVVQKMLNLRPFQAHLEAVEDSNGPGNAVFVEVECEQITEIFSGFGRKGRRAETVAKEVVNEVQSYLKSDVPVGPHLADQLILPMALAGSGRLRTVPPTSHTKTQIETVKLFLDVPIALEETANRVWTLTVGD